MLHFIKGFCLLQKTIVENKQYTQHIFSFFRIFESLNTQRPRIYFAHKREITKHDLSKHLFFIKLPDCHMELA